MTDTSVLRLWKAGKHSVSLLAVAYFGLAVVALNFAARFFSALTGWNILWLEPVFDDATTHLIVAGVIAGVALGIRWLSHRVQRRLLLTALCRYERHPAYSDHVETMTALLAAQVRHRAKTMGVC